jgi:hypothetical protein
MDKKPAEELRAKDRVLRERMVIGSNIADIRHYDMRMR